MKSKLPRLVVAPLVGVVCLLALQACTRCEQPVVVVYTALDRIFSQPILDEFTKRTGIKVLAKYDTESTKTIGLVNGIRAEKDRPRCDVFWNNEIVNTIRLKNEGMLTQYIPAASKAFPVAFKDPDGYWSGFAARARVLLVNTNLLAPADWPDSVASLADPRWKGRAGMAKPLFGTTATHAASIFAVEGAERAESFFAAIKANSVKIQSGNKTVAVNVAAGVLAFGLTDTDDAIEEVESGKPVVIVYPDCNAGQSGVLFIPNTLSLIKNAPHPEAGRALIEYLLSPEVETALAKCPSAQIPLNPCVTEKVRVKTPSEVKAMAVDFSLAAQQFEPAARCMETLFLK